VGGGAVEEARAVQGARDEAEGGVADAGLFLHHDHFMGDGGAHAAVLLGDAHAQQAQLASLLPDIAVDAVLLAEFVGLGSHFLLEEAAGGGAQHLQLFGHPGGAIGLRHGDISTLVGSQTARVAWLKHGSINRSVDETSVLSKFSQLSTDWLVD